MAVWRMENDCLAPEPKYRVEYVGPNPFRIVSGIKEILKTVIGVETKDVWERDFRWDITSDPRGFYVRVMVAEGRSYYSRILYELTMQGFQPSDPTKDGRIVILLGGVVRTEFKLDSAFKRSPLFAGTYKLLGRYQIGGLLWVYTRLFYNEMRKWHLHRCQEKLEELWITIRNTLNMPLPERNM